PPGGCCIAAQTVAAETDKAHKTLPKARLRTANGTTRSGRKLRRRRNRAMCPLRSTRHCYYKLSRERCSCAEEGYCKRPAADCPHPANRGPSLPTCSETILFPA